MRVLLNRRQVIEWAGELHAYPLAKLGDPGEVMLSTTGENEAGWARVGWRQFFTPLDRRKAIVVSDSESELQYRILLAHEAHAVLPREAFGPSAWKVLAREVCTAWPPGSG